MPPTLPKPGSVWLHKITKRLMRAAIVDQTAIIAHNCELAAREPSLPMVSWAGDPELFLRAFKEASPEMYPATHN